MPLIMLRRLAASLALLAIAPANAEVQMRGYPSLAKRPVESRNRDVPVRAPVQPAAPDASLATQVDTLGEQAASGDAAFQQQIAQGRRTASAAAGSAPTTEAWVAAEMAISVLDSARYETVAALAGLDTLYIGRLANGDVARASADLAMIDPVRTRVLAMVDAQNDALDGLRNSLRQP
jgi:hypothetical protein